MARRYRPVGVLLLFVALAVAHTWPLATAPGALSRNDNADTVLNEWIVAWVAHQVVRDPVHLFDANIFYPEHHTLAFSEPLIVPALMGAPLLWLGASPVLVYNLLLIAGFALTGWTMSLLIGRWTDDWAAGILAGCLVAFNAHTLTRLPHLQAIHAEFLPLALLALDRVLQYHRSRDALKLACWFMLTAITSIYLMLFALVALTMTMLVRPTDWLGRRFRAVMPPLCLASLVALVALIPFLVPYYLVHVEHGAVRSLDEVAEYTATASSYLTTVGRLHFALWSHRLYTYGADSLFPGFVALALAGVAVGTGVAFRDQRGRMLLTIGAIGFLLSFGPKIPVLYGWLYRAVPLFQGVRGAARFGYLALLGIGGLAGFGLAGLRRRWGASPTRRGGWMLAAATVAVITVANIEALRAPITYTRFEGIPHVYRLLEQERHAVVAEIPFFPPVAVARNAPYMLASTQHWKPLLNGYSGFTPPSFRRHAQALATLRTEESLAELKAAGVTHIVVHTRELPHMASELARLDQVELVATDGAIIIYKVR